MSRNAAMLKGKHHLVPLNIVLLHDEIITLTQHVEPVVVIFFIIFCFYYVFSVLLFP